MQRLLFLHANGYPTAVYRQFLDALAPAVTVIAPDVLTSPAGTPPARRWVVMRQQVSALVRELQPDAICGHSMGGYLALCAAADALPAAMDVVMIDSPIPSTIGSAVLSMARGLGLTRRIGPAPIAARRRDRWSSLPAARDHFARKDFVRRWAPGVLDDFVAHALQTGQSQVQLRIPRDEERDIYTYLPHEAAIRAHRRLRRAGLTVGFIAGAQSRELALAGLKANQRRFAGRFESLPTGHLVPMEAPADCARLLLTMLAAGGRGPTRARAAPDGTPSGMPSGTPPPSSLASQVLPGRVDSG